MTEQEWSNLHTSPEYKLWRRKVYHRDGYKCRVCSSKIKIQAHHIYPLRSHFEKRFEHENGITLCFKCHRLVGSRELELVNIFEKILKNDVNSGKLLPDNAEDNPEPSVERNLDEGLTTRNRNFFLEQFITKQIPCAGCGKILSRHYYRTIRAKNSFCNNKCRSIYLKGKNPPWYLGERIQFCLYCKKQTITPSDNRRIKKYCNNLCQMKYQSVIKKVSNVSKSALPERDDIV